MGDKALKGNKLTRWLTNYSAPWDTDSRPEKKMETEAELKALFKGMRKVSKDQSKFKKGRK